MMLKVLFTITAVASCHVFSQDTGSESETEKIKIANPGLLQTKNSEEPTELHRILTPTKTKKIYKPERDLYYSEHSHEFGAKLRGSGTVTDKKLPKQRLAAKIRRKRSNAAPSSEPTFSMLADSAKAAAFGSSEFVDDFDPGDYTEEEFNAKQNVQKVSNENPGKNLQQPSILGSNENAEKNVQPFALGSNENLEKNLQQPFVPQTEKILYSEASTKKAPERKTVQHHEKAKVPENKREYISPTPQNTRNRISKTKYSVDPNERYISKDPAAEIDENIETPEDIETQRQAEAAKYSFATSFENSINDNAHARSETRDGLKVTGHYSYSDGYFKRTVHYVADENGYRIISENVQRIGDGPNENELGTARVNVMFNNQNPLSYTITGEELKQARKNNTEFAFL